MQLRRILTIALALGLAGALADIAYAQAACTGGITGNIHNRCKTYGQAYNSLPCGVTGIDDPSCGDYYWDEDEGCTFGIGDWSDPKQILFEWYADESCPTQQPSDDFCFDMWATLTPCGPPESPEDPECPDEQASGYCSFPCDDLADPAGGHGDMPEGVLIDALWGESCHAIVLMPRGWREDPFLPAAGFFTVGRAFPPEALAWSGPNGESYSAVDALVDDQFGPYLLSPAGGSPLWGGEGGVIETDWTALNRAGICLNSNALLGSPHWNMLPGGVQRRRALVRCDGGAADNGMELYFHSRNSEADWIESGALASEVRVLLDRVRDSGLTPVCVTAEVADRRRAARYRLEKLSSR